MHLPGGVRCNSSGRSERANLTATGREMHVQIWHSGEIRHRQVCHANWPKGKPSSLSCCHYRIDLLTSEGTLGAARPPLTLEGVLPATLAATTGDHARLSAAGLLYAYCEAGLVGCRGTQEVHNTANAT